MTNCRKAVVTIVYANDQILAANSEEVLHMAVFKFRNTMECFNLQILVRKSKRFKAKKI